MHAWIFDQKSSAKQHTVPQYFYYQRHNTVVPYVLNTEYGVWTYVLCIKPGISSQIQLAVNWGCQFSLNNTDENFYILNFVQKNNLSCQKIYHQYLPFTL